MEPIMDAEEDVTFLVTGCEVAVVFGTEYAVIQLSFVEKPVQTSPSGRRRYVLSYGQLAELRGAIEEALRALKNSLKHDPPVTSVH
jgi:hypothetical protein